MTAQSIKQRAAALGFFDGLHLAHRAVLNAALEQKNNGLSPAVLLFDAHPYEALTGQRVDRLMTDEDRRTALLKAGFEILDVSFQAIQTLSPADFVNRVLWEEYHCGFVSCGYNYTFGAGGKGNAETLRALCAARGIRTSVCDSVRVNGAVVSSSVIRAAIRRGDMETANKMLGNPFSFSAVVLHGDSRGKSLGFPTANQMLPSPLVVPKAGVYAAFAQTEDGTVFPAVTNIGSRPTFDGQDMRSESHLLGFEGDLYGKTLRISLHAFLRAERKFPSVPALLEQIAADADLAEKLLRESK